jgi:hypothetical protein
LNGWLRPIAGLVVGGIVGILARVVVRMVYDSAANTDRFDVALFVIGTLVVTVAFLVAAAVSTPTAVGAAVASTGTLALSWMGLRLIEAQPIAGGGLGYMADELRWGAEQWLRRHRSGGSQRGVRGHRDRASSSRSRGEVCAMRRSWLGSPEQTFESVQCSPWRRPDGRGRDRRKAASEESPSSVEQARG